MVDPYYASIMFLVETLREYEIPIGQWCEDRIREINTSGGAANPDLQGIVVEMEGRLSNSIANGRVVMLPSEMRRWIRQLKALGD